MSFYTPASRRIQYIFSSSLQLEILLHLPPNVNPFPRGYCLLFRTSTSPRHASQLHWKAGCRLDWRSSFANDGYACRFVGFLLNQSTTQGKNGRLWEDRRGQQCIQELQQPVRSCYSMSSLTALSEHRLTIALFRTQMSEEGWRWLKLTRLHSDGTMLEQSWLPE